MNDTSTYKPEQFFEKTWTRKPSEWCDCNLERVATMPEKVINWILTLPKHRFPMDSKPLDYFPKGKFEGENPPRHFVAEVGNAQYIVSTEGYNYGRYAVRIKAV